MLKIQIPTSHKLTFNWSLAVTLCYGSSALLKKSSQLLLSALIRFRCINCNCAADINICIGNKGTSITFFIVTQSVWLSIWFTTINQLYQRQRFSFPFAPLNTAASSTMLFFFFFWKIKKKTTCIVWKVPAVKGEWKEERRKRRRGQYYLLPLEFQSLL